MNADDRERQRLQRLHDEQIRARDPGPSKFPGYDWSSGKPAPRRPPLLVEIVGVFPARIRGLALGMLLGLFITLAIHLSAPHLDVLGLVAILVLGIVGWVLGAVVQS